MKVSIHQPQYWPWLPYFLKIAECDVFILLDSVDFQKNGLQNRNLIKTAQGAQWLTVPVRQRLGQTLIEVEIDNNTDWRKKHWLTITQNYGKAKAFRRYAGEIESVYLQDWKKLTELNIVLLQVMLRWLGIERTIMRSSEMQAAGKSSALILNLCLEVGAKRYISGDGGQNYLDEGAFNAAGVEILFRTPALPLPFPQQHPSIRFIDDLSALDIFLNCGDEWRNFLPVEPACS